MRILYYKHSVIFTHKHEIILDGFVDGGGVLGVIGNLGGYFCL